MKAYFFVITPLNYLYALQASLDNRFNFHEKHLIVLSDFNRSKKQLKEIIDENQWYSVQYPWIGTDKNNKSRLKSIFAELYNRIGFIFLNQQIRKTNSSIFWGNYNHKYSQFLKGNKNRIFFLDDGFSTINILRKIENNKTANNLKNCTFYTTFKLNSAQMKIEKHELEFISNNNYVPFLSDSIYFLGQPLVFNSVISEKNYIEAIDKIFNFYTIQGKKCYYLPHRSTNRNYIPKGWSVLDFNFPIEFLHLIEPNKTPNCFMTFYSTGVFNLKHIHKLSQHQYLFWEIPTEWINEKYKFDIESVYNYLKSNHFLVKDLLELNTETDD